MRKILGLLDVIQMPDVAWMEIRHLRQENEELVKACEQQFNEGADHGYAAARAGLVID